MLTLREKKNELWNSVALPTNEDWQLLCDEGKSAVLIEKLNAILVSVLKGCKEGSYETWGAIALAIFKPIDKLAEENPDADISSSEGSGIIALFFAINYDPTIYSFLRYREHSLH
ncbi:MAG: hypothetical protein PHF20_01345 [Halothiobacillaceae bacterium]|nr:hypothetical protein [Halothiobacillaceae bacterium]